MYKDSMYAIDRSDEYLAHYGVKGMRWGIKRAYTKNGIVDERRLDRVYRKAQRKLAKLERRANNGAKYGRRAAALGAGAAVAGAIAGIGPRRITAKGTALANRVLGGNAATKIARLDAGKNVIQKLNLGRVCHIAI